MYMHSAIVTVEPDQLGMKDESLRAMSCAVASVGPAEAHLVRHMLQLLTDVSFGRGLSAVQVGVPIRLFVFLQGVNKEAVVFINPTVLRISGRMSLRREGCLSLPGWYGVVARRNTIHLEALDIDGRLFQFQAHGYDAAVIQHELDHLDGVLYWDRMDQGTSLCRYRELAKGKGDETY